MKSMANHSLLEIMSFQFTNTPSVQEQTLLRYFKDLSHERSKPAPSLP